MKLVVGLGNPGKQYERTRHNVGFLAIDALVGAWSARGPKREYESETFEARLGEERVLLIKPQTFMNLSGRALAPAATFYKCTPEDIIVIHDDLDLAPLRLKVKTGGGTGGHNGLKSIDQALGAVGYHRIRIGVGRPTGVRAEGERAERDYVLEAFDKSERAGLEALWLQVRQACEWCVQGQAIRAMNEFNAAQPAASAVDSNGAPKGERS